MVDFANDSGSPDLAPLGVIALDHTAIAVSDLRHALFLYRDLLGGEATEYGERPQQGFRVYQLHYPNGASVELIAPLGEVGFVQDFLAKHGEGVHHLTFLVLDLRSAVERARSVGLRVVGEDYSDSNWYEAFISPRNAFGTIVQLAQTRLTLAERRNHWQIPPDLDLA